MNRLIIKICLVLSLTFMSVSSHSHYPTLDCRLIPNQQKSLVECLAGFSDRSKASNIVIEVYSEDDELVSKGKTSDEAIYRFEPTSDTFFIIMDAGPGHVLEISDEDVVR